MKLKHLLGNLGRLGALAPLLLAASMLFSQCAYAQLSGTKNIPGDYPTLDAAITDLNTVGVLGGGGGVTLNLLAGNAQTAPAGGYAITTITGSSADPIVLEGNGNTITAFAPQTAGLLHDAIFEIRGADYVTLRNFNLREDPTNTITAVATNNMTEWGVAVLYDTTTNGAQNVTLQNNIISLNRTYQNTFGIYANSTHSATTVSASATATTSAGGNSGLRIYGNTIGNVNNGITVVGPTASADHNEVVDIGGTAPATGNVINDYGTTGTFSGYANVSGSVNGILVRNSRNYDIAYNTITSSVGGVIAGTLRGIFVPAFSVNPTGTLTDTVTYNRISVRSGAATGAMFGILVDTGTSTPTSTTSVSFNDFHTSGHTVAASGAITFLQHVGSAATGPLVNSISSNTFSSLSVNTTGNVTLINNDWTRPAGATTTVSSNRIVTSFAKTGAGGNLRGYNNFGSSPATATENHDSNDFSNISVPTAGATTIDVWRCADGPGPSGARKTITNNTFTNISATTTSPLRVLIVDYGDNTFAGNNVSGNTIHTVSSTGGSVTGIASGNGNQNFFGNTIHTLTSGGASNVFGMQITGGTTQAVYRNKTYNLENSNALGAVTGITVGGGTTVNLHNNLVGDLRLPNATTTNNLFGINVTGGTTVNAAFNSVYLAATSVGANFGSTAFGASTTPALTLRDNNLVNLSTPAGTGLTVAYRRSSATLPSYQAASNTNNLWAGAPGPANLLFHDGTTGDQTLTDYKTRMSPRDSASVTEMPPFLSTTGASSDFLHINTTLPTQLESGGLPVAGITDDYDGDSRSATTPDIGADEFTGMGLDTSSPVIAYPPLPNTTLLTNRAIAANISDPSGVAGGGNAPRVYFRKGAGAYVSAACTGTAPAFTCTIDNSLLGGVVIGDSVSYFVIAQDSAGNVGANPGAGLVATDVNTVTTPPTTPNSYTIIAPFPAVVNVGATETITSLTNPGGLFDLANGGVFTSDVIANITSDLSGETGSIALNQRVEEGAGGYLFTIRPLGAPRTVTGAGTVLAKINGSDRVLIDGALSGTNRDLTFNSTSVATGSAALFIGSLGPGQGANNVRIRNVIIQTGTKGSAALTTFGLFVGHSSGAAAGPDNDGFRLENSQVRRASVGLQAAGDVTGLLNGLQLLDNDFGDDNPADSIGRRGLVLVQTDGALVRGNQVRNVELADNNPHGMLLATGVVNSQVIANRISNVRYTGTGGYGGKGIDINTGNVSSGLTIANNFIAGIGGDGWTDLAGDGIVGLRILGTTGGINVWHNSINLGGGSHAGYNAATASAALYAASTAGALNIRNNILANNLDNTTVTTDKAYAIATNAATAAPFVAIDGNDYFVSGAAGLVGLLNAVDRADLAAWQAASLQDLVSISGDPPFVSATDLHVQTSAPSPVDGTAIPIGSVPNDIDGDERSATTPDIGADEFDVATAPSITPPANQTINEEGNTGALAFTVNDGQTPVASLVATVQASSDTALIPLANIVIADAGGGNRTVTVTPVANGSGGPATTTLRVTDGNSEFTDGTFTVTVNPVNDEPSFSVGANQSLAALSSGVQTVAGWATAISAGPSNESGQTLAFTVTETSDPNGIVSATTVASNGTLQYTLNGIAGTANFDLYLADDGGTANGGDDTSPTATFSITVANGADLAIVKTSSLATLSSGVMQYTIVVSNLSPNPVVGAVVADTLAPPHTLPAWTCSGIGGGVCPLSGSGDINATVDLPVGGSVTFQLATTVVLPVTTLTNTATVTAPLATPDPISANNSSTVTDTIAIFMDGFDDPIPPPPWYTQYLDQQGLLH
ncbi:MAG: hypothetical protein IPH76_02630 [Xanthomonadales bacterium]|nr:hypothetical protein [Xanthomonadales bacterium]